MLDGYGLHTMIWDSADERLGDFLVASPADAAGRGLELHVRQGGAAADLTGAEVYFMWKHKVTGERIVQVFEIDPAGYSSASARSYDSIKLLMKKVYIDSSIAGLGITNCNYWFNAFSNCTEVRGFENLSGMTSANQMFTSCGSLETIYATSFSNSGLSGSLMFNSCNRLVGGKDGFVPSTTSGASVCKLCAGGVLTDPNDDRRTWFWAHFYADGEGVLTASSTPDSTRELVASNRICAIGKYVGLGFTPGDQCANEDRACSTNLSAMGVMTCRLPHARKSATSAGGSSGRNASPLFGEVSTSWPKVSRSPRPSRANTDALYDSLKVPSRRNPAKQSPAHCAMSPRHPCSDTKSGSPTRSGGVTVTCRASGWSSRITTPHKSRSGSSIQL